MQDSTSSDDLVRKTKRALKAIVTKCTHYSALEKVLSLAPASMQKHVLAQFQSLLPNDTSACKNFVKSGGLKQILLHIIFFAPVALLSPACIN
jgi:hypothetical protein